MFYDPSGWKVGSLAGVDISVSFGYVFLLVFYIAFNGLVSGLIFGAAVTLSLIIHEMGHALVAKKFKLAPSVLLHGFGGLCFHQPAKSDRDDILIVVAGPLLEIAFGLLALGLMMVLPLTGILQTFVFFFAWVSIVWGAANLLLPLWPLDGGRLLNLILRRFMLEPRAQEWSLKISVTVAIPIGIFGIIKGWLFIGLLAFFIILDNINAMRAGHDVVGRKAKVRVSPFAQELLGGAEKALTEGDFREAYRACHQLRASNHPLTESMQDRVYEILALTAYELEEFDEAKGWAQRVPNSKQLVGVRNSLESRENTD